MIFDSHVRVTFRASRLDRANVLLVADLLGLLDGPYPSRCGPVGIDRALVVVDPRDAALGEELEANDQRLADAIRPAEGRLVAALTINPLDDADRNAVRMRDRIGREGFRAIKLHPTRHGFLPHRAADLLGPIMEEAAGLRVPVFVHVGEPPFGFPSALGPVIEAHPDVTFVLCNFGTQQISYALEAIYVARINDNVLLQTSHAQLAQLRDAVQTIGPSRLLFASDLPEDGPAGALACVETLTLPPPLGVGLSSESLDLILSANASALLDR